MIYGSGKSNDLKPGTPPLPLIVGASKALRIALIDLDKHERFVDRLNNKIIESVKDLENIQINKTKYSIPHILNLSVLNINPEVLIHALDEKQIYLSTNTACSSGDTSNAVMAVYNDLLRAKHTIRISLSHLTTTDDINEFIIALKDIYNRFSKLN